MIMQYTSESVLVETVKNTAYTRRLRWQLMLMAITIMLMASIWLSYNAWVSFEKALLPEIDKKSVAIGRSIVTVVERSLTSFRMTFNNLKEVDEVLDKPLKDHVEIHYIAITDTKGELLYYKNTSSLKLSSLFFPLAEHFMDEYTQAVQHAEKPPESVVDAIEDYYNTTIAIHENNTIIGLLHLGVEQKFVQNKVSEMTFDVITLLILSLLIAAEFLLFLINFNIATPIRLINHAISRAETGDFRYSIKGNARGELGHFIKTFNKIIIALNNHYQHLLATIDQFNARSTQYSQQCLENLQNCYRFAPEGKIQQQMENNLINIRIPIFLFMFAEELSRSFFPLYVRTLQLPELGLSEDVMISLPISLFMLVAAIAMPVAGRLSDRYSSRQVFLMALIPSSLGYLLTGTAHSFYELLLWRSFSAFGYGMMFIACQSYVSHHSTPENRTQGMAMFVSAVMAAAMCGPAIGGILADQIGFRWVFGVSAFFAIPAALMVYFFLPSTNYAHDATTTSPNVVQKKSGVLSNILLLSKNKKFVTLAIFGALPVKFALTGFICFFIPIYLHDLEVSQSSIGRTLMLYGITAILVASIAAKIVDKLGSKIWFISISGFLAGFSILVTAIFNANLYAAMLGVALLGVSHAVGIPPQLALIPEICADEVKQIGQATIISIYRLVDRLGAVLGSLVMASLFALYDNPQTAAFIIGLYLIFSASILSVVLFSLNKHKTPREQMA